MTQGHDGFTRVANEAMPSGISVSYVSQKSRMHCGTQSHHKQTYAITVTAEHAKPDLPHKAGSIDLRSAQEDVNTTSNTHTKTTTRARVRLKAADRFGTVASLVYQMDLNGTEAEARRTELERQRFNGLESL